MKAVIIKFFNFIKNQLRSTKLTEDVKSTQIDKNLEQSPENEKQKLNAEMKYLFPSSEIEFKNFANDTQNYSTIIHHHENMVNSIKSFLKNENIDKTIDYIQTLNSFYKNFSEFYLNLLSLDKLIMNDLNSKIPKSTNTLLSFSIWGHDYAEKFCLLALSSVKEDLIETHKKYKVQMLLFIDESAKEILENNSNFIELNNLNIVTTIIIPNNIFKSDYYLERIAFTRYYVFGFIQNICWRFSAKNEINLSLLTPDNYYSKNFFKNLIYKINEKKNLFAIFSNSCLKVQLNEKDNIKDLLLSLEGMNINELFNFFKKKIHHSFFDYFISEEKKIENNSSMYILNSNESFFIYSAHCFPYILSKEYLKKYENYFTFLPLDEAFPFENDNDINFFEKMLVLEDGLALDFASYEDTKKNMVLYSEDNIIQFYSKFKNSKLNMWFLKNPLVIKHKENSDLTFNYIIENKKSLKTVSPNQNDILLKNFQQLIQKI